MSAYELACWRILEMADPWGPRRFDYLFAKAAWLVLSSLGCKMGFRKFYKTYFDFEAGLENKEQNNDELELMFEQIAAANK